MANTEEILRLINEKGLKKKHIASELGISTTALWRKIRGLSEFDAREIVQMSEILGVKTATETNRLFLRKSS